MAVNDKFLNTATLTSGQSTLIRPDAGVEVVIHNIHWTAPSGGNVELATINGSTEVTYETSSTKGGKEGYFYHCTNTQYYRIRNAGTGSINISYDGVVTK